MVYRVLVAVGFVAAMCACQAGPKGSSAMRVYDVRNFGATGDGKTLDSPAIDRAINACASAGGGTVYVGAGTYLSGSIHLKSNIDLMLDAGATIVGAPQAMNVYDETEAWAGKAYQDGGHCYFHNSLIWGENLTNVSITGHGTINGGGLVNQDKVLDGMSGYWDFGKAVATAPAHPKPLRLGNKAIALKLCKNVLIRDITIAHGGHFAILVTGCDEMTVDNVTMDTNRDGIDIDCCRNTMVSNCRINSPNDDGLCPKSTFALGERRLTENLTITNCQVSGWDEGSLIDGTMRPNKRHNGRIKFGTESSGGYRNCTISNCTFRGCKGLALEEVDGGIMENITISNITMMDVFSYPIYLTTGKRNRTPGANDASVARNILISNVVASGIEMTSGIQITGLPELPVEGVRLENIRMQFNGGGTAAQGAHTPKELGVGYPEPRGAMPGYGVFARHAKDLELANVTVGFDKTDQRPAMVVIDVDGLEIDNFKAKVAEGVKAARFEAVKGEVIRNSPLLEKEGMVERKAEASAPQPDVGYPRRGGRRGVGAVTQPAGGG